MPKRATLGQQFQSQVAKKTEPWFKRRSPLTQSATLSLRTVYIFLSREGILYGLLLLITFVAGINYANNLILGLCFLLASVLVVTIHYTFAHLAGLTVKLVDVSNAQIGEKIQIRLQLSSQSKQPHRQIRLSFVNDVFSVNQPLMTTLPRPELDNQSAFISYADGGADALPYVMIPQVREPVVVSLWLKADKRGRFQLPKLTVSTVYPLGILQAWSYVFLEGGAWIYPDALAYDVTASQFTLSHEEQSAATLSQAGQDDFDQLDTYVVGESLARISWSHVARGQGLLSKRFVDSVGQEQLLDYYQMPATTHEDKLRQLRHGVDELARQQVAFRLRLPDGEGTMGQGKAFVQDSLLRLAKTP